jgi:hypothetical protein
LQDDFGFGFIFHKNIIFFFRYYMFFPNHKHHKFYDSFLDHRTQQ